MNSKHELKNVQQQHTTAQESLALSRRTSRKEYTMDEETFMSDTEEKFSFPEDQQDHDEKQRKKQRDKIQKTSLATFAIEMDVYDLETDLKQAIDESLKTLKTEQAERLEAVPPPVPVLEESLEIPVLEESVEEPVEEPVLEESVVEEPVEEPEGEKSQYRLDQINRKRRDRERRDRERRGWKKKEREGYMGVTPCLA